jgi:hypothetical protein
MRDYFVFGYWNSDDHSQISEMKKTWSSAFPRFTVFGDADVLPFMEEVQPDFIETYLRIRFPSAKSDVGRLIVLHRFGGLYVDCHMGIINLKGLSALFERLTTLDHIFVDADHRLPETPRHPEQLALLNGMIMSRPGCAHILDVARQAMSNLAWQRRVEAQDGFRSYQMAQLCGPTLMTNMTLQPGSCNREVRRDLADRVAIIPEEEFPVARNRYRSYSGVHWSQRQKTELLFEV